MVKTINISLTAELLKQLDQYAHALYASRSEYIRHAVIEQMRLDDKSVTVRATMAKQLPQKYIKSSDDEEFELSDQYV